MLFSTQLLYCIISAKLYQVLSKRKFMIFQIFYFPLCTALVRQLYYYITFFLHCQYLFSLFTFCIVYSPYYSHLLDILYCLSIISINKEPILKIDSDIIDIFLFSCTFAAIKNRWIKFCEFINFFKLNGCIRTL